MWRKGLNVHVYVIAGAIIGVYTILFNEMKKLELNLNNINALLETKFDSISFHCTEIQKEIRKTSWKNISDNSKTAWRRLGCQKNITHPGELIGQPFRHFEGHNLSLSNHISGVNLVRYMELAYPMSTEKYSVDIGAAGASDATDLMARGWKGFQSDGRFDQEYLSQHINQTNRIIVPENVHNVLKIFSIPKRIGLMKVDIDSYDWDVLKAFLDAGVYADIYSLEFNPVFPPNVHYHMNYSTDFVWTFTASRPLEKQILYGASLRAWHDLLAPRGYTLIDADWYNAFFVRDKYADIFGPIPTDLDTVWRVGWFERAGRHTQEDLVTKHWLNYPRQEVWATMETSEIIKEIKQIME
ncbi:unnamed protein product [Owenia fusiformis]|uniref:Uncharacterized protein n=1 Tax=Owenia fusiformis TaxID=6347 RepID=A0A8J1XZH1_OWEFU|nr:unnamed protein product [Owenia fusiformis]